MTEYATSRDAAQAANSVGRAQTATRRCTTSHLQTPARHNRNHRPRFVRGPSLSLFERALMGCNDDINLANRTVPHSPTLPLETIPLRRAAATEHVNYAAERVDL